MVVAPAGFAAPKAMAPARAATNRPPLRRLSPEHRTAPPKTALDLDGITHPHVADRDCQGRRNPRAMKQLRFKTIRSKIGIDMKKYICKKTRQAGKS
jgi:hypothetical protein